MRMLFVAATAAALVGGAPFAFAAMEHHTGGMTMAHHTAGMAMAHHTVGTIKSLSAANDTVTLANGSTYGAPKTMNLSSFKVGEKVAITYTKDGMAKGKREIETVAPAA